VCSETASHAFLWRIADLTISPDPANRERLQGRTDPLFVVAHTPRAPLPNEVVIDKPGKESFYGTDLEMVLHLKGIRNLVLVGITTDVYTHESMAMCLAFTSLL
jgi:nicotinamidase-related amidase